MLTGVAVAGSHVEDGVAVVVVDVIEGVCGECGGEVLDVGEVAEAAAQEEVLCVLGCRRHGTRSVISHPHLSLPLPSTISTRIHIMASLIYGAPLSRRQPRMGTPGHHGTSRLSLAPLRSPSPAGQLSRLPSLVL